MPDLSTLLSESALSSMKDEVENLPDFKGSLTILRGLFTGGHFNASGGRHYANKNFGRDSAISMLFLLDSLNNTEDPEVRRQTRFIIEKGICSLVHWQGGKEPKIGERWRKNAEEKGKIHHEAGPVAVDELGLVNRWQENDDASSEMLVYFGSVDATPLYISLVSQYISLIKKLDPTPHEAYRFLLSKVPNFRGGQLSIAQSLLEAIEWVDRTLQSSDIGFIEYSRKPGQEEGIRNQVWKDSLTSYVHLNGQLANTDKAIASIEVQALAYDAYIGLAEMFESDQVLASSVNITPAHIKNWRSQAKQLQNRIFEYLWLDNEKRFVQALDRNPKTGELRHVATPSSNELHLLNSRLFDDLAEADKKPYIESLSSQATSDEFLTDLGIRCRARSYAHLINFTDYHGSWAVWPWESHWIASGLRHQHLDKLADQVDRRVMNAFIISGEYPEFYLVNPSTGTAYYKFVALEHHPLSNNAPPAVVATNIPDTPQTWSAAAAIDIYERFLHPSVEPPKAPWIAQLEQRTLGRIDRVDLLHEDQQLDNLRKDAPVAIVDLQGGKTADDRYYDEVGGPGALKPAIA